MGALAIATIAVKNPETLQDNLAKTTQVAALSDRAMRSAFRRIDRDGRQGLAGPG